MVDEVIVKLTNIRKEFPGIVALDNVNLTLKRGQVHALVGENGAGKSTLMKILSGSYRSYEGQIIVDGHEVRFGSVKDALNLGIAIVPQELHPVPELSIAENIFLGREPRFFGGVMDKKGMKEQTRVLLRQLDLDYDPEMKMSALSVAQKQMIEIIKAISRNSRVIIMDEPTSALTDVESAYLFRQIALLKGKGIAIVFISHKLDEVFAISDEISVLRDGQFIGNALVGEISQERLINMMVGREVKDIYPDLRSPGTETLLEVRNLTSQDEFKDVSFTLAKGEILGFSGMMGAGRSEIARAVFGLDRYDSGEILLEGKPLRVKSARDAIRAGIAMVTEDRSMYGFVGVRSIKDNVTLPNGDIFSRGGILQGSRIRRKTEEICRLLSVKAHGIDTLVGTLSGGNQQKVVLSKWLVRNVKILILDEPTRGIDVGSKQEIYRLIARLAGEGISIILISSEMPEVLALSHRIAVVAGGRIVGRLDRKDATQDRIMKMIVEASPKNA